MATHPKKAVPRRVRLFGTSKAMEEYEDMNPELLRTALLKNGEEPYGWQHMTKRGRLEYIADRMLAEDRDDISSYNELRETGILSKYQYQRRIDREVYGKRDSVGLWGGQDSFTPGMFRRAWCENKVRPRGLKNLDEQMGQGNDANRWKTWRQTRNPNELL